MTKLWVLVIVVVLFVICVLIALYMRNQHKHQQILPPKPDPRRTDTQLMPRIDPNQKEP